MAQFSVNSANNIRRILYECFNRIHRIIRFLGEWTIIHTVRHPCRFKWWDDYKLVSFS
ncbi:MAG TPA: hypothetical protein V6C90_05680 [Coleofasciculaceae cyanobacterium]